MEFSTEKNREVQFIYQNGDSEWSLVTPLGTNLYRLELSSVLEEVHYHDIVEAELQNDGTLRFIRLVTPSGLKTMSCMLPRSRMESPKLASFLNRVIAVGGFWERLFGGVLILNLPSAEYDLMVGEFESLFDQDQ
jgi:hypothetical protein